MRLFTIIRLCAAVATLLLVDAQSCISEVTEGNVWSGTYYQYVPSNMNLTSNKIWQVSLCSLQQNDQCQRANEPQSYIYALSDDDGTPGSCDLALSITSSSWAYGVWNGQPAMQTIFSNALGTRKALVSVICQGNSTVLAPINFPNNTAPGPGWYAYSNYAQTVWTWEIVLGSIDHYDYHWCGGTPYPTPAPPPTYRCAFGRTGFMLGVSTMTVPQWVPSDPNRTSLREWTISPCAPVESQLCTGISAFISESSGGLACDALLNVAETNWTFGYGGLNALFTDFDGTRAANVTLVCGKTAALQPLPTPDGWYTHLMPNGLTWMWDMRFATNVLPICSP